MEHRTLKVIPSNTFINNNNHSTISEKISFNNKITLKQQNGNSQFKCQENNALKVELPPPARILPYSGIKPQVKKI